MGLKLLVLVFFINIVAARISINVNLDKDQNVNITHSGLETDLITDDDIKSFKIENDNLLTALKHHLGKRPKNFYLGSPTPWGDLYKTYNWEPVKRLLSIKSAKVKSLTKNPIVVLSQDFVNSSNQTIKVNTGITHTIENTFTSSWSREKEFTVSQEIEYEFNVGIAKATGITGFSFTNKWGITEEKSKTEVIGTSSGMEVELKPGKAVMAVLSANAGYLEIEVVHMASLRGNVAVNFKKAHRGHHFWGPSIKNVMQSGGIKNEVTTKETIQFGFHVEGKLRVYDKETGLPI